MQTLAQLYRTDPTVRRAIKDIAALLACGINTLEARSSFAVLIRQKAEHGYVTLVVAGMDCDGVAYAGRKIKCRAIPIAVEAAVTRLFDEAEGPIGFKLMSPSKAAWIEYETRDFGAEAHENGHPSTIRYRSH